MTDDTIAELVLKTFHRIAAQVPAYRMLLNEAGIAPDEIETMADFARLPVLEKHNTFLRFSIEELCLDSQLGRLASVLTSSGHSGVFAFGLTQTGAQLGIVEWIDNLLDTLFAVRSQSTLLINCLPMGVKVHTEACTLAEVSVRPDMAIGLIQTFERHFAQIILVGEAAFVKLLLESGERAGIEWPAHRVHVILGEEPLAENARKYLQGILGIDWRRSDGGIVCSSMGVGEIGLNLFSEVPPLGPLMTLRRVLHEDMRLREAMFGAVDVVPSLFTFDPRRIFVEFDSDGRLLLTTLDPRLRLPLIRYTTGDCGSFVELPESLAPQLEEAGVTCSLLRQIPIVAIHGRGKYATGGGEKVYPESVKEGIYLDPALARLTTANFRIVSGPVCIRIRIQLSPGIISNSEMEKQFKAAISRYVHSCFEVICEPYESFRSGMALDYERKFDYLGS